MIETLPHGYVTWTLTAEHFTYLRRPTKSSCESLASSADFVLTIPPSRTRRALQMTRCESIETTTRKRRLFPSGVVARQIKERLLSRVMFGTMAGGVNAKPGGQFKTWHRCIVEDLREFRATEGSTELSLLHGVRR